MTTLTFDTLKFANRLKAAGVPPAQAEAEAEALAEVLADALKTSDLATRTDVETLRREIAEAKADIIKWLAGLLIAQAAVVAALVKLL
jgi:broad-specificity NMP kinase